MFWALLFVGVLFCLLPRFTFDAIKKTFYPRDIEIIREMWLRGDFDRYPEGYDPTDPSRPRIDGALACMDFKKSISLDAHLDGISHSQETIFTEEIPMSILEGHEGSLKGYRVSTSMDRGLLKPGHGAHGHAQAVHGQRPRQQNQNLTGPHQRGHAGQPPVRHKILRGACTCLVGPAGYQPRRDITQHPQPRPAALAALSVFCTCIV